jgi:hypothetical protein
MSRARMSNAAPVVSVPSQQTESRPTLAKLYDQIKKRLAWLGGIVGASTGTAVDQVIQPVVLPIVQDGEHSVNLIEITPSTPAKLFEATDFDHVWCLVVDDTRFTWHDAAKWILNARELNILNSNRHLPTLMLVLKMAALSREELSILSSRLTPIGVLLTRWPEQATSVEEALTTIRGQLEENYGEPNFDRKVRWGHSSNRQERSRLLQTV